MTIKQFIRNLQKKSYEYAKKGDILKSMEYLEMSAELIRGKYKTIPTNFKKETTVKYPHQVHDYNIKPYYHYTSPTVKKYMVSIGDQKLSVFKNYEDAAKLLVKLVADPWYLDRGYTRSDRLKAAMSK
jgi:hypothetical protein